MKKLLKYLVPVLFVGSLAVATTSASAQVASPNYWRTSTASSTISPINTNLQVPCANIVGGCGGSSITSSSVVNASSVTASLLDKGGAVFNVKAFGAKCDGSTDDATAVSAAMTAAAVSGGTVLIPNSTCVMGSFLTLASNVALAAAGPASTLKEKNGVNVGPFIRGSNITNFSIQGLTIDYNGANNASDTQSMGISSSSFGTLNSDTFKNFKGFGIGFTGTPTSRNSHITVENCTVTSPISHPNDMFLVVSDYAIVTNNRSYGNDYNNASMVVYESDHALVTNNTVTFATSSMAGYGIWFGSLRYSTMANNNITGLGAGIGMLITTEHDNASPVTSTFNLSQGNIVSNVSTGLKYAGTSFDTYTNNTIVSSTNGFLNASAESSSLNVYITRNHLEQVTTPFANNQSATSTYFLQNIGASDNATSTFFSFQVTNPQDNFIGSYQSSTGDASLYVSRSAGQGLPSTPAGTVTEFISNAGSGFSARVGIVSGSSSSANLDFGSFLNGSAGTISWNNPSSTFTVPVKFGIGAAPISTAEISDSTPVFTFADTAQTSPAGVFQIKDGTDILQFYRGLLGSSANEVLSLATSSDIANSLLIQTLSGGAFSGTSVISFPVSGASYINNGSPFGLFTTQPSTTLQIASGSLRIGVPTKPLCIEGYDSVNTSTLEYFYTASNALTSTTTKPAFCQ